jgi:hypothetical protein
MPAVIPFAALAAAIVALLTLYATGALARAMASFLPNWHIPGLGHLRDAVISGISHALGWIGNFMDDTVHALAYFLNAIVTVPLRLFNGMLSGIEAAATVTSWTVRTFVPRELGSLRRWTSAGLAAAHAYVVSWIRALQHSIAAVAAAAHAYTAAWVHNLQATISAGLAVAHTYTATWVGRLQRTAAADLAAAEAYARATAATISGTLAHDIASVDGRLSATAASLSATVATDVVQLEGKIAAAASSATAAALGVISTDIEHVIARELADITGAIGAAEGVAAGDFADVLDWIRGIDISKITDIAGVTALTIGITGALTRYLEKCGMPNCRNLSRFGRDLQALFRFVDDAALLALFIDLAVRPEAAAREFVAVVATPLEDTIGAARSLLGVG